MALLTVNGVETEIFLGEDGSAGGIEESWPEGQPAKAVVHYKVPWASRFTFIAGLRGGVSGGVVKLPHAYPPSPNLTCVGIGQIRGIKPKLSGGFLAYEEAIVPAEYGVPQFDFAAAAAGTDYSDPSGKAFTNTDWEVTVEVFQPPIGSYYWEGGPAIGEPVYDSAFGIIRPRVELRIKRSWLPYPPLAFFLKYGGTINDTPVRISDAVFPRGTLLLPGGQGGMSRDGSLEGRTGELNYSIVANGPVQDGSGAAFVPEWNHFVAKDGTWHYVNQDQFSPSASKRPYRYADFWKYLP